jgi:dCMP deaminase
MVMGINRLPTDDYFMSIAYKVAGRSTCDRAHVGAVIVRDDNTICSTGYNGAPRKQAHCDDVGHIMENGHCVRALHAEGNALDWAYERLDRYTLYTTHFPCWHCAQRIVNRGIVRVVYGQEYRDSEETMKMLRFAGVSVVKAGGR